MHPVIEKTFGGLSLPYYLRQFVFGASISALMIFLSLRNPAGLSFGVLFISIISAGLYPYSRFVYESIVGFVVGENVFFVNVFLMLFTKIMTIILCWGFAIFIAPLGLAYLYFHHSKKSS